MRHFNALGIKFLVVLAILGLMLPLLTGAVTWGAVVMLTLAVVAISYPLGDLGILPVMGQGAALVGDFLLGVLLFRSAPWLARGLAVDWGGAVVLATGLAMGEFFFHRYMEARVLNRRPG